ncbi:protein bassoon isoform X1 [Cololabis saira]|uniref:protein bassoon isoform X1 n=1 Tax=Cololabis saira TaxID=129043 RepID=UPI002AD521B4|nr:protein bassoon isoform X1 [Cololabis saira]XP_061568612.1 protein bassoon isoform X1 [Cololabis saira]
MKPDGVATAALEPMETLESNPVNEAAPPTEQQPNQAAAAAAEEEMPQQPVGETGQGEPQANPAKGSPAAKTGSKTSGDPKAKATNKGPAKTKPSATSSPKTLAGPRSNTIQSRISNGTSKPQTNGVAKKAAPAAEKKSTPTSAPSKKPAGTAGAPISKSTSKVGEKKATGPAPATNAAKSTTGALAAKKTTSTAVNGVKPSTAAAAKKPPASRPGSAAPTKPSSAASAKSDKPPVAKTTRPTTGTSAPSRPATGSSLAAKTSATSRPAAPKTSAAKPPTPKSSSTTPSGGKAPASQTSRTTTPVKKDVTKPSTPGAKKPTDSPLSRPSSTTKSAKPETPKSSSKTETAAKKPSATKGAETKTPTRSKTQDSRPTPSKDASKTTSTKTAATKSSPKKTVGSSTPTPVKRGPKPSTAAEPAKEIAASVAAAAAIATAAAAIAGPGEVPVEPSVPMLEAVQDKVPETSGEPGPKPESVREPEQELVQQVTVQSVREPTPEPVREPTPEPPREPTPEPVREPTPEPPREPTPEPVREPTPEPPREPTPEPPREPTPEPPREPTPEPMRVPTPEPMRVPTPEPMRVPTPEPMRVPTPESLREPTPESLREPTPEPMWQPSPEPLRELSPEPLREPSPEPLREPSPEYLREPSPEPLRELSPEPVCRPTAGFLQEPEYLRELTTEVKPFHAAEPAHEPSSQQSWETSPESPAELSQPSVDAELGADLVHHPASRVQMSSQMDCYRFEESGNDSVPSLGTTVMSPPCSPTGPASPVRQPHNASYLLEMDVKSDEGYQAQETWQKEEEEEEDKENMFLPTAAPRAFDAAAQPHFLGTSPLEDFTPQGLISPHDKEEAVEKADQEINEDVDYDEDYDEEDEQRRLGHQLSSMITDMSMSQPSDELQARSSGFGGSAGWHGDDVLSGMDSEDISSCTSSRQQGVSDVSSTQHTAILEGTQSSDALVDSSLRGSEGDCNLMGSPNVETLANEEEDEDEDEERVDDMDMSSERVEEHHKVFRGEEQDDEEDEDVEMHSEGVTEACGNVEEDFTQEENLNLSHAGPAAFMPPASSWGQSNPFSDPWAQTASLLSGSSPSPMSDHGAADSETPTQPPAQARLDGSAPPFAPESEHEPQLAQGAAPGDGGELLAAPAVGMSQSSTLSGTALAAHSSSETSTPEELRDYDSSSGVESHSDKQQTPVPAPLQPDMEQDLGIHLEKGDGEEEEAETLPADEVLGTGPPTAPASNPSSPSTSGDEASDTEGEMQINDPEAPMVVDDGAGFESTTPTSGLAALDEDEEVGDALAGDCEEDGGGATPQSANSVASYGFDCTNSNSNAHSMAESCGKSPGIFSLENEEQLPEEAKDPSLIKELTLPSAAAAQAEDLLGSSVDLMPLGHPEDSYASWDDHRYLLGGKLEEADPLGAGHDSQEAAESQPAYYSTICDKTDSFLEGDEKSSEEAEDYTWQTHSQEDNRNQNQAATSPVACGHYLALVPGNRRPIDPTLAEHFATMAPPLALTEADAVQCSRPTEEQMRRLQQHQDQLRAAQHRQEQERQKRQWLEEERLRLEQQKQLEQQRRELLQLQMQQQQQEQRHRRHVLQWQLELEHQYRLQQKHIQQQQQQLRRSPTGVMLSPSSGLCTIYEAMETSEEEDDEVGGERNRNARLARRKSRPPLDVQGLQRQLRPVPPQELQWNQKVDMVQQLINQTLILSGDGSCPPLLLLPVGTGGTLSPLESSMWPHLPAQFSPPSATVTSVSSYSPDSRGSSPSGDWTVVEVETQH